jgi:hypothetical protein
LRNMIRSRQLRDAKRHSIPVTLAQDLALLSDILPTGFHGCIQAGVTAGSTVYIAGAGPVGLAGLLPTSTSKPQTRTHHSPQPLPARSCSARPASSSAISTRTA